MTHPHKQSHAERSGEMSKTDHTPGPWRIGFLDGSGASFEDSVYILAGHNGDEHSIVRGGRDDWNVPRGITNEANARLIASAPEMLVALEQAEQQLDYGQIDHAMIYIRAAIAKATGRGTP